MPESKIIRKIRVTYKQSSDYKVIFADSALVGQAIGKAITLDFYVGNFIPVNEIHTVMEDNKVHIDIENVDPQPYERILQVQVVMTPENAEELVKIMSERIKALKS